jgi:hypothetical protein
MLGVDNVQEHLLPVPQWELDLQLQLQLQRAPSQQVVQ